LRHGELDRPDASSERLGLRQWLQKNPHAPSSAEWGTRGSPEESTPT
jgi:hypothetical protein